MIQSSMFGRSPVRGGGYGSPGSLSPWIGAASAVMDWIQHSWCGKTPVVSKLREWVIGGTEKIADKAWSCLLSVFCFKKDS
jgi:hypothetical protein